MANRHDGAVIAPDSFLLQPLLPSQEVQAGLYRTSWQSLDHITEHIAFGHAFYLDGDAVIGQETEIN